MPGLDKAAIIAAKDVEVKEIDVPEWGGAVYIRVISGRERDAYEASISSDGKSRNLHNMRARLVVLLLSDKDGNPLFQTTDAEALGKKSSKVIDRLFEAGRELNNMMSDEELADLAKNSSGGPNGDSGSSSRKNSDARSPKPKTK